MSPRLDTHPAIVHGVLHVLLRDSFQPGVIYVYP